ncbi:MAG: insulinase family protein [Deltaproteobacteria bacterium]|nr:insulinase family protein [Deltaproteobacteria bacterium]
MKRPIAYSSLALLSVQIAACATPPPPPPPPAPTPVNITPSPIEAWRANPPAPGQMPALVLPALAKDATDTGLTILLAERHTLPLVTFSIVTKAGSAMDPPKKGGLTALAWTMLGEGAGKRGSLEFSDAVADLGATFGTSADQDRGNITIRGLVEHREAMMALLADVLTAPKLDTKDFDRKKSEHLASLIASKGSPMGLAFVHVPALLYGEAHPYGHPASGTEESVATLTAADVKAQIRAMLNPNQSALIVSGDIDMAEAKRLAKKFLGKWRGAKQKDKAFDAVEAKPRSKVIVVEKASSPQTLVLLGRPIFGAGHPDQAALEVTDAMYGGVFSSRLNLNLREAKGYTYGARSGFSARRGVGAYNAYAMVKAAVTGESVKEFFAELDGMKTRAPDQAEIDRTKEMLIRSLPGDFETTSTIAGAAGQIFTYGLPLDWYTTLPARIGVVDAGAVKSMVEKYLTPERMQVLLVGEADKVSAAVAPLNLGPIEVRK